MATKAPAPAKGGFNAKDFVRVGVTEEEVKDIKLAFDLFDHDGGGAIDPAGKIQVT
jgi:Ca2+-binding EF-hand superfamily protein